MNTQQGGLIEALIRGSFRHKAVVALLVALAAIFGATAYQAMPRNVYPDITIPVFTIVTENEAMAPEEIESLITRPMEAAMNGLPGVQRIRSQTSQGLSSVVVEFDIESEFWRARQFVSERMAQVAAQLPPGTEPATLSSATTRLAEVYELAVEGDLPLMERREIADWQVRYNLLTVPGVAEVLAMGGEVRQYRVTLDPRRLQAHDVKLSDVEQAVRNGNENASGGFLSTGPTEYTVRGVGRYESAADIGDTVIAERNGTPLFLRDVGDVREGSAIRRGIATRNGKETVVALVIKQPNADTVQVVEGIEKAVDDMRLTLPKGIRLTPYYDQTHLIRESLAGVQRAILLGGVLVVLVLLALLGHFRSTLIVALSLPVSVLIAGVIMRQMGVGLNTLSLGGLAIAVGIMVDASIIMVENIHHRLNSGTTSAGAPNDHDAVARSAAIAVSRPIAFATLIIIAVFLPLFMMGGIEGLLFQPLAITVAAAMLVALALSLTLTPVLASRWLRPGKGGAAEEVALVRWLKVGYVPLLERALARPWAVLTLALVALVPAGMAATRIGRDFMPKLDEGSWFVSTVTPAETSLEENHRITGQVDAALRADPDIVETVKRNGRSERAIGCVLPVNSGELFVNLKPKGMRSRPSEETLKAVREKLEGIPGVAVSFSQPLQNKIDESMEGTPAALQVKLFGPDISVLTEYGRKLEELVRSTRGVADVRMEQASGIPQLQVRIDRRAAARHGVSVGAVSELVRLAVGGEELTQVWQEQRSYGVHVRYRDDLRADADAIGRLLLDTPSGARVPLAQVASVTLTEGPNVIWREAMSRRVSIDAGIQGRDLSGVVGDIKAGVRALKLPAGYTVVFGGQYQSQQRAMRSLALATGVALVVVFILLYLALGSAGQAGIILATVPSAFVGGVVSLLFAGETLNVSSAVGFIALFGIAVQNSLVLLTQTREFVEQGRTQPEAIRLASVQRLRPKLMTAACAALGLLPILLSKSVGAEIERPLAVVMVGGLVTSTLFTLLVLPAVYLLLQGRARPQAVAD